MRKCLTVFLPVILGAMSVGGCGVKFASQSVNRALPGDYANRTRISNSADYRFHMEQNIGAIIEPDPSSPGQYRLAAASVIRPANATITEEVLAKDDNQVFHGKITSEGSLSGNYAVVGVSLSAKQAVEISIVDIARAEIQTPSIPVDALRNFAKTKGPQKQYWIKSLLLSRVLRQDFDEESANATGSGPAFGVDAKVYHTQSDQSQDYNLTAVLIDLDTYKDAPQAAAPAGAAPPAVPATHPFALIKATPAVNWTDNLLGAVKLAPLCAQPILKGGAKGAISNCKK